MIFVLVIMITMAIMIIIFSDIYVVIFACQSFYLSKSTILSANCLFMGIILIIWK